MNLEDALAGELDGIFTATPHSEAFNYLPSDTRVFNPIKARFAKPKTKQEAAELLDVDDAPAIQKQMEQNKSQLKKPAPNKDND
jgi:hypothetical protein